MLLQVFAVVGTIAADEFRTCPRSRDKRVAYAVVNKVHRHRNFFQMHADHRKTDIKSRVCFDVFNCDGVFQRMIASSCERTARFRKRHDVHFIVVSRSRTFGYYGAVEVFTALSGYENAVFVACLFYPVKKRLRCFGTGIGADFFTEYLTRGASDDEDLTSVQLRRFNYFFCGKITLLSDFFGFRNNSFFLYFGFYRCEIFYDVHTSYYSYKHVAVIHNRYKILTVCAC